MRSQALDHLHPRYSPESRIRLSASQVVPGLPKGREMMEGACSEWCILWHLGAAHTVPEGCEIVNPDGSWA